MDLRWIFRFFMLLAFALFCGVFVYAYYEEETLTQLDETTPAPFSLSDRAAADQDNGTGLDGLYNNGADQQAAQGPAVTHTDLEDWLGTVVAEALTLEAAQFETALESVEPYFTASGYQAYYDYLKTTGFRDALDSRDLRAVAMVECAPLLLNSGSGEGGYRWLYEVPVTLSYLPQGADSYTRGNLSPDNQRVGVRVQVRQEGSGGAARLRIESWDIVAPRG